MISMEKIPKIVKRVSIWKPIMMIVVQCNKISKFFKLKKIKLLNKNNNNNNNKSI